MVGTSDFHVEDYIETKEDAVEFLNAALEDDPNEFVHALGTVAKSKGMSEIAKAIGVSRSSLYKTLSDSGNPNFYTVLAVMSQLGLKVSVKPAAKYEIAYVLEA